MAYSEAQKRATMKYMKENYDELRVRVKKGGKQIIESAAKTQKMSLAAYVKEAVNEKLNRDGQPSIDEEAKDGE